jgi:DNA-binding PadR family transcriptional regulator
MALQEAMAALLLAGPSHGYQLMATLEAELGPLWETRASRVYLTLSRMEREGLVTSTRVPQDNRPDRRLLQLTPKGRSVGERWLDGQGSTEDAVIRLAVARSAMPTKFGALAAALVSDRTARLQRLRGLRRHASEGFQPEALEAEIFRAQADLRWLGQVRDRQLEIVARRRATRRNASAASERAG